MKVHRGIYDRMVRGGCLFVFSHTLCTGQVWLKTTGNNKDVTCRHCLNKLRKK